MKVIAEGMCCTDCVMMIANGEIDPESSEEREAEVAEATADWVVNTPEDTDEHGYEPSFSWQPCDLCECELGGNRWPVAKLG